MGGGSSQSQKDVTKVRRETTTNIGDIGLTGQQFVRVAENIASENRDAAADVTEAFKVTGKQLSGALATGFQALSQTAESQQETVREQSRVAAGREAEGESAEIFGGVDMVTAALILGGIASAVTVIQAMK